MDYYKPTLSNLRFIYNHNVKNLSIQSQVNVLLPAGESLIETSDYSDMTKTVEKTFDHLQDPSHVVPFEYVEDSMVEIMNNIDIPYDEQDPQTFIIKLRAIMADEYTVIALVKDKSDHSATGGSDTKIFTKYGTVVII